jgi:hypothetical protein
MIQGERGCAAERLFHVGETKRDTPFRIGWKLFHNVSIKVGDAIFRLDHAAGFIPRKIGPSRHFVNNLKTDMSAVSPFLPSPSPSVVLS